MTRTNKTGLIVASIAIVVALTGCGDGRQPPPSKAELEAKIQQIQNNPQMSAMAKKMTIGSLRNMEKQFDPPAASTPSRTASK